MNILQIKETCIYARDLEKMKAFYHGLLGLPIISYLREKHIFFRAGTSVLLCFNPDDARTKTSPPAHYSEGKYHFAFEIPANEYEAHKAAILAKNIAIIDEITWDSGMKSFYFEDPAGNVLEMVPAGGIW